VQSINVQYKQKQGKKHMNISIDAEKSLTKFDNGRAHMGDIGICRKPKT
jgi:hypothetical protein